MPDEKIAAIAAKQHGAFTTRQARKVGFTPDAIRHRLATGRWVWLHRGVYAIAGAPATRAQAMMAAVLAHPPHGAASHTTSATLLGLMDDPGGYVHVTVPIEKHRRKRTGIVLHKAVLGPRDTVVRQGIRATAPNRTLVDLASVLPERALEAALDNAIQIGLTTIKSLRRYINERNLRHRRGMGTLRRLLDDRADGAVHKELERMFRRKLKGSGLPEPVRQYPLGPHFIDFVYLDQMVAIELDGLGGHFSAEDFRRDKRKDNAIVLAGFDPFHFSWEDVNDRWPDVERTIRRALKLTD